MINTQLNPGDSFVGSLVNTLDVVAIKKVTARLYDGTTLTFDDRRDLAKILDAVMDRSELVRASDFDGFGGAASA